MLNPSNFTKIGAWPNGQYFNYLVMAGEAKKYYQEARGLDYGVNEAIYFNDNIFYPLDFVRFHQKLEGLPPEKFVKKFNRQCEERIRILKKYAEAQGTQDYAGFSDDELAEALENFDEQVKLLMPFLNAFACFQELLEGYALKKAPNLDFREVRPLYKISSERLNDDLLSGKKTFEQIRQEYGWYTLSLLRGSILTIAELEKIRKNATHSEPVLQSSNEFLRDVQMLMWLKFERIDAYNYAFYKMYPLLEEAFRRAGLDIKKYLKVILPTELQNAVTKKEKPSKLDERFSDRGLIMKNGSIRALSVDEVKSYNKLFLPGGMSDAMIRGRTACPGKVKGIIKVIHDSDDLKKLEEGDILVATETIVSYEPYMKKCAAMIVEVGGLLSHTAIFAREFKIPTIIGVKNATKIVKDGEMVEVDAADGKIKRISP